jgi:hypothetical protein
MKAKPLNIKAKLQTTRAFAQNMRAKPLNTKAKPLNAKAFIEIAAPSFVSGVVTGGGRWVVASTALSQRDLSGSRAEIFRGRGLSAVKVRLCLA